MAVSENNTTARLRLADNKDKTMCTFAKIKPNATPDNLANFASNVNALRNTGSSRTYLIIESELVNA